MCQHLRQLLVVLAKPPPAPLVQELNDGDDLARAPVPDRCAQGRDALEARLGCGGGVEARVGRDVLYIQLRAGLRSGQGGLEAMPSLSPL